MSDSPVLQRIEEFNSDAENGLSKKQANLNRRKYGSNKFQHRIQVSSFKQVKNTIKGTNLIALLASIVLAIILQNEYQTPFGKFKCFLVPILALVIIILKIVFAIFTSSLSYRTDAAFSSLLHPKYSTVAQSGRSKVSIEEIVCGDVLILGKGEFAPAELEIISTDNGPFMYEEIDQSGVPSVSESRKGIIPPGAYILSGTCKCLVTDVSKVSAFAKPASDGSIKSSFIFYAVVVISLVVGALNLALCFIGEQSDVHKIPELFAGIISLVLATAPDSTINAMMNSRALSRKRCHDDSIIIKSESIVETIDKISTLVISHHGGITSAALTLESCQYVQDEQLISASSMDIPDDDLTLIYFDDYEFSSVPLISSNAENIRMVTSGSMSPTEFYLNESKAVKNMDQRLKAKLMHSESTALKAGKTYAILAKGTDLTFVAGLTLVDRGITGILGLIEACKIHKIRVVLCSPDNQEALKGVASKLRHSKVSSVIDGKEWTSMSDREKRKTALKNGIFSSFDAEKREELVQVLEENGEKVGFLYGSMSDIPASRKSTLAITSRASMPFDILFKDDYKNSFELFKHVSSHITTKTRLIVYMIEIVTSIAVFYALSNILDVQNGINQQNLMLVSLLTQNIPFLLSRLAYSPRQVVRMGPIQFIRSVSVGIVAGVASLSSAIATKFIEASMERIPSEYVGTITVASLAMCHIFTAILNVDAKDSVVTQVFLKNFWITASSLINTTLLAVCIMAPHVQDALGFVYIDPQYWLLVLSSAVPVVLVDETFKLVIRLFV